MGNFKDRIAAKKAKLSLPTAAASAAVAMTTISQQAEAAIVIQDLNVSFDAAFDPRDGSSAFFGGSADNPFFFNFCSGGFRGYGDLRIDSRGFVPAGTLIGPSATFVSSLSVPFGDIQNTPTGSIVGFRMTNQGPGNDETHYGWAVTSGRSTWGTSVLNTTDGQAIGAGATTVPEPSVSLFGASALLLTLSVRRRKGAQTC